MQNLLKNLFRRTSANSWFWSFKTTTENRWVAVSALVLSLSSDNLSWAIKLLTIQKCVSLAKDWFMLHKKFNQDLTTQSFNQEIGSCEIKSFFTF